MKTTPFFVLRQKKQDKMEKKSDKLEMRFSLEPSSSKGAAALLTYRATTIPNLWALTGLEFNDKCSLNMRAAVLDETPAAINYVSGQPVVRFEAWKKAGVNVRQVEGMDLSFERFWSMYGNKIGNKARVQKKWERMAEGDRILAMASIGRYRRYAEGKHINLVYPETYIDQRRWEDEYPN